MRRFLIDTDAAADDLIALQLALNDETVSIEAITVVSGACPAEQGAQNVLYLLELIGRTIPVHIGRSTPLFGPLRDSSAVMGKDGLGDIGLPLYGRAASPAAAPDIIRSVIKAHPNEVTIVCLGPLTNLALAFLTEPAIIDLVGRLVIMGGVSDGVGNVTPVAEYNIWADPEAARVVFESGARIELVGWDISRTESCAITPQDLQSIRDVGTSLAGLSVDILAGLRAFLRREFGSENIDFPDPITMAIALDPAVATGWIEKFVEIDVSAGPSRGATIVDHLNVRRTPPNARIALGANKERVLAAVRAATARLSQP